ncbi:MAG: cysteine desulfurase family protein [Terriglobia bacterium]|jgi:cysteine desulfurase
MVSRIYLDHSATTPLDPRVRAAMGPYLDGRYGNPSSLHQEGREARNAVEKARAEVAALLGAEPSEIIFTASGTEADNLALVGAIRAGGGHSHLITSAIEHAAVLETCHFLERTGTQVTYLPVNGEGLVDPGSLRRALRPETRLASIMTVNNVVGTVQPIAELAQIAAQHGSLFHTDAVQAIGKIPMNVKELGVDMLALSAHKLHGPKGVGALYVRRGVSLDPIVFGGGQERGLRSATENVAGIVGLGAAAALARDQMAAEAARLAAWRERILQDLREKVPHAYLIGHPQKRLPGHLCLGFAGQEDEMLKLVLALDEAGVAVSAGSACSSAHVGATEQILDAMGFDTERARGLLRVTLGRFNTDDEVERFLHILPQAVASLAGVPGRIDIRTSNLDSILSAERAAGSGRVAVPREGPGHRGVARSCTAR